MGNFFTFNYLQLFQKGFYYWPEERKNLFWETGIGWLGGKKPWVKGRKVRKLSFNFPRVSLENFGAIGGLTGVNLLTFRKKNQVKTKLKFLRFGEKDYQGKESWGYYWN